MQFGSWIAPRRSNPQYRSARFGRQPNYRSAAEAIKGIDSAPSDDERSLVRPCSNLYFDRDDSGPMFGRTLSDYQAWNEPHYRSVVVPSVPRILPGPASPVHLKSDFPGISVDCRRSERVEASERRQPSRSPSRRDIALKTSSADNPSGAGKSASLSGADHVGSRSCTRR